MEGIYSQKSMQALGILSSVNSTSSMSTNSVTNASTMPASSHVASNQSVSKIRNANPFLEPPARKLYKQYHDNNLSEPFSSVAPTDIAANQGVFKHLTAMKTQAPSRKPQRLVLTRVFASNSVIRPVDSATSSALSVIEPSRYAENPFANAESESKTPHISLRPMVSEDENKQENICSYTVHAQHPSTTPKAPPNREYYDFIKNGLSTSTSFNQRLEEEDLTMDEHEQVQNQKRSIGKGERNQQQQENQETQPEGKESIPVNSAIMAFARKSIMQHASSSPQSIFRKLSNNKKSAAATYSTNISASQKKIRADENQRNTTVRDSNINTVVSSSTAFTFVSRPNELALKDIEYSLPASSSTAVTMTAPIEPTSAGGRPAEAVIVTATTSSSRPVSSLAIDAPSLPSSIFNCNVLDLSQQIESTLPRKRPVLSNTTAHTAVSSLRDTVPEPHQAVPIETPAIQLRTPPTGSDQLVSSAPDTNMGMDLTGISSSSNACEPAPFDIRSLLRMDYARTQYQLPSLIASLSPPASPKRRPSPYTVLSTNERDALRLRRMPRFKARPLNPKVFTSAGDLGVPRIPKQPLTVPVSPVFSKPRVRNTVSERGQKKDSAANSAAALRFKNMIKAETAKKQSMVNLVNPSHHQERTQTRTVINDTNSRIQDTRLPQPVRPAANSSLWSTPLSVPTIDQTRASINRGSIKGPPLREEAPTTSTSMLKSTNPVTAVSMAGMTVRSDTTGHQRQQSKLRRPATRPVPFTFATTELQRRRMLFQPTSEDMGPTAAKSNSNTAFVIKGSSDALTLEDL